MSLQRIGRCKKEFRIFFNYEYPSDSDYMQKADITQLVLMESLFFDQTAESKSQLTIIPFKYFPQSNLDEIEIDIRSTKDISRLPLYVKNRYTNRLNSVRYKRLLLSLMTGSIRLSFVQFH